MYCHCLNVLFLIQTKENGCSLVHGGPPPYLDQAGLLRIDDRQRYKTQCFLVLHDKDFYALNCKQRPFMGPSHNVGAAAGLIHYMTESKKQIQYHHRPPV